MKKYRWTVLLLALVLAAGVCAGCGKKQTDAPAQDNQIQTNPDEVTAVTYTNGTITLRFSLQDGRWCWSDDKTFPLDGSYITALLADVQGGPPISITEEDLESYGLGGVTKYIEITTAEKTVTYYLGDPCGDGSSYGVPLVGMTAAECGVEYADWYLNVAWSLIQQYRAQGQTLSVKDAIEMAKNGTVAYNEPAYGPVESIFAGMP